MKKLMFLLIGAMMLASCEKGIKPDNGYGDPPPPEYRVFTRSYVMGYFEHTGIDITSTNIAPGDHDIWRRIELILLKGNYVGTYLDESEKKEAYDAICEKYGDMSYNDFVVVGGINSSKETPGLIEYPVVNITSINIVSNAAFDEDHPAGTSLNDIFYLAHVPMTKHFIENGYGKNGFDFQQVLNTHLSEVVPEELVLTGRTESWYNIDLSRWEWGAFDLFIKPTLDKHHTFTVTVTFDDGRVLADTVEMTFD